MMTNPLLLYQVVITVLCLVYLLITLHNLIWMRRLPSRPASHASALELDTLPLVSVLVPARNEERNISRCLESLLAQQGVRLEVIVLDDQSTDGTGDCLAALRTAHPELVTLQGQPLPANWHGKAWACHQLAAAATGDWLLFTDADTCHQPHAVAAAVALAERDEIALLSLMPDMGLERLSVWLGAAVIPLSLWGAVPHAVHKPWQRRLPAIALGSFLLFRRRAYERVGGHAAVRRDITEDFSFAKRVKALGERVVLADGVHAMRVTFYASLREAWHGLSKSAFPALGYSLPGMVALMLLALGMMVLPYGFVAQSLMTRQADLTHLGLPLLQILMVWLAMGGVTVRLQLPAWRALLTPIVVLLGLAICADSMIRSYFGVGTAWKGRAYQFRKP